MSAAALRAAPCAPSASPRVTAAHAARMRTAPLAPAHGMRTWRLASHRVDVVALDGTVTAVDVPAGTSVLDAALDAGVDAPYDCRMGVCMRCSARLKSGSVDQTAGMLSDDVKEKGYVLLCVAEAQEDCTIEIVEEEELLAEVLVN